MDVYKYSQARQNLALLLEKAVKDGAVAIRRKDGKLFVLKEMKKKSSLLDVKGIDSRVTTAEIIEIIREGRERG